MTTNRNNDNASMNEQIIKLYNMGHGIGMIASRFKVSKEYVNGVLDAERRRVALRYAALDIARAPKS